MHASERCRPAATDGERRSWRAVAALAVAASSALLGACADPGPSLESTGLPTPTVDPVEDLADGTSGTTVPTENGCRAAPIPDGGDTGTAVAAAIDTDREGLLRVHRDEAGSWRIRVEADDGETFDAPLQVDLAGDPDAGAIGPVGAVDLDGDGVTELFTVLGDAPGADLVTIHARVGCALVPVTVGGGTLSFPIGSRPTLVNGLACADHDGDGRVDGVTGWIGLAEATDGGGGGRFRLDGVAYDLAGTELVQIDTVSMIGLDEPGAAAYGVLDCPGLPRLGE